MLIYLLFVYFGLISILFGILENGGFILMNVVNELYGMSGKILLGFVIIFVCLIIFVGLIFVCVGFFINLFLKFLYKMIVIMVCVFSLIVFNLGLI